MSGARTLLVNYWYAHPVGHAIEALRYCLGYKAANPEVSVSVLLNAAAPTELATCCAFVDAAYAVEYRTFWEPDGDPHAALAPVPRDWDWVVDNERERQDGHAQFRGFRAFYDAAATHFRPRLGRCWAGRPPDVWIGARPSGIVPDYRPHQQLRLELPEAAREAAAETLAGRPAISAVLAGSSAQPSLFPSAASWKLILSELSRRHPEHALCLVGKLAKDGRTTSKLPREAVDRLLAVVPASVDCFDRPLLEQLAVVEASSLYLSPHTGFGMAALAVGTPWLALSGGQWHEWFFNGVPFHSVVPDTRRYPCFGWGAPLPTSDDEDGEGPRTASMSIARIREDLPELLHAAEQLIRRTLPYEQALAEYFPRLLDAYDGDRSRVFSLDGIHERYLGSDRG
jgi:hypothetical protein